LGFESVNCNYLTQDRVRRWYLIYMVVKLFGSKEARNLSCELRDHLLLKKDFVLLSYLVFL
jgi:hypothetical protein